MIAEAHVTSDGKVLARYAARDARVMIYHPDTVLKDIGPGTLCFVSTRDSQGKITSKNQVSLASFKQQVKACAAIARRR